MEDAILDAALQLFMEDGPDGASIERIAARAGVTRPTVYRRWADRDAVLVDAIARVREQAEHPLADASTMSVDDVLAWMTEVIPTMLSQPAARLLLARLIGASPDRPELLERYWADVLDPRWAAFGALLQQSSRGTAADGELLSDIVAGALAWRVLVRPGPTSEADIRDFLIDVLGVLGLTSEPPAE